MKTPITKAIEILQEDKKMSGNTFTKINYGHAIDILKNLLEEEKEVIIAAWQHGENRVPEEMKHINNPHLYYKKTFKND